MATPLEILTFNLQERTYPYFQAEELQLLLDKNNGDLDKASYEGCLMKAEASDGVEVKGVILGSNREYWLTLAQKYNTAILKAEAEAKRLQNQFITSMQRSDGC